MSNPSYGAAFQESFVGFDVAWSDGTFRSIMSQELAVAAWTTIFESLKQLYDDTSLDTQDFR